MTQDKKVGVYGEPWHFYPETMHCKASIEDSNGTLVCSNSNEKQSPGLWTAYERQIKAEEK